MQPFEILGWIITILAVFASILVTRRSRKLRMYGFLIWVLTNGYYMYIGYIGSNFSMTAMFLGYQVINIIGILNNRTDT